MILSTTVFLLLPFWNSMEGLLPGISIRHAGIREEEINTANITPTAEAIPHSRTAETWLVASDMKATKVVRPARSTVIDI